MSEENVEIVRRIYEEGLIYRDPEGLVAELGTPDIEYVNPPYAVEPGTRRGPAEVAKALRRAHELFASPRYVIHDLFDRGDAVVALLRFYETGKVKVKPKITYTPAGGDP
jgi:glutathione S-transferase